MRASTKHKPIPVEEGRKPSESQASAFDHSLIDDLIHSRLRLAIMAVLMSAEEAEFTYLRERTNTSDGNLSVHLRKLEEAGYIKVRKLFRERKPVTFYSISNKGATAFQDYVKQLEGFLGGINKK